MKTLSFQVPEEMKDRLESYAKQLDRSKGYLIRQALAEYFEDMADYLPALRYKATHDSRKNISLAAIKRKYKLK